MVNKEKTAGTGRPGPQSVWWALFSLKGRIRRATYGLGIALIFSIWWVALAQMLAVQEGSDRYETWALILGLVALASGYCLYALAHKRLHDLGFPGWYALTLAGVATLFPTILLLPLVGLGLFKGQLEKNAFGPPPVSERPDLIASNKASSKK